MTQGRADLLWHDPPPEAVDTLAARYPTQLHSNAGRFTYYLALNTRLPPFNGREARQAVAYWINRSELASDPTGAGYGQVTCQVLPPRLLRSRHLLPLYPQPGELQTVEHT